MIKNGLLKIKSFFSGWIKDKNYRFTFYLTLLYSLLFNLSIYLLYYENDYFIMIKAFIISVTFTYIIFIFICRFKWLFVIMTPLLFFISSVASFAVIQFKLLINHNAVALIFEATSQNTAEVISIQLILWVLFHLALSILIVWRFLKKKRKIKKIKLTPITSIILLFPILYFIIAPTYFFFRYLPMPMNFVQSTVFYAYQRSKFHENIKNKTDISKYNYQYQNQNLNVVLIIGEAARAENFHINGYHRKTSPYLEKLNVVSYPFAQSCDTVTSPAVSCLLTRATIQNQVIAEKETSFISIFKKVGFYTSWISNQGYMGSYDTATSVLAKESHFQVYHNKSGDFGRLKILDEQLLPYLKEQLKNKNKNKLFVIHSLGSHWKYDAHYPDSFRKYKPVCTKNTQTFCKKEEVTNSYDNSLLYTDFFISKVIHEMKNRNSLVIFISDHGESLGENGIYSHTPKQMKNKEQRSIAMFIWASDKFKKKNPKIIKNIKMNKNNPFEQENIFYSILHCAGIKSPIIKKELSFCYSK